MKAAHLWRAAYALSVTALLFALFANWAYDDPFITFRYAENVALGNGFVFNIGERVLSTTTPLFTLVLAAARLITPDLPRVANFISAFSVALGALCLLELVRSWRTSHTGDVMSWVALLLYPTFSLLLGTFGSEMAMYVALCLATLLCYAKQRYTLCGLCAASATLTRNDGLLLVVVIALHLLLSMTTRQNLTGWRTKISPASSLPRQPVRFAASFAPVFTLIVGAWVAFAWLYFGWPLPVTLAAKRAQGAMSISAPFANRFLLVLSSYAAFIWYRVSAVLAGIGFVYFFVGRDKPSQVGTVNPKNAAIGMRQPARVALALLLSWTALYFIGYSLLRVSGYIWYYAPLVPAFAVLVGLGAQALADALCRVLPLHLNSLRNAIIWMGIAALVAPQWLSLPAITQKADTRQPIYHAVGDWLRTNTPQSASVGMLEVGIIGYYAQRRIIDFAGLIQPDVTRQITRETKYEQLAVWATEQYKPEYIVLHEGFAPELQQGYVAQHCQLAKHFVGAEYGHTANMNVFKCDS